MNDKKNENQHHGEPPPLRPAPESPLPLAEEIEDAMRDQDIPVETGVRPVKE